MPRNSLIQVRRDTAANWTSANPMLGSGEPAFETDTGRFKLGDGVNAWETLPAFEAGDYAATRTALAALPTRRPAFLTEGGREGTFVFSSANLSASVTADPAQGIYVAPSSAPTGASGAWVRRFSGPVDPKWFGATGDGATDDALAFKRACDSGHAVRVSKPSVDYRIASGQTIALTQHLEIDCQSHPFDFDGGYIVFAGTTIATGLTLSSAAARYATSAVLNSAAGIQRGDLLYIDTNVNAETAWPHDKKDLIKVKSVSGTTVELEEPIQFAYATADAGLAVSVYRPYSVRLVNPNASLTTVAGQAMFDFQYCENVEVVSPRGVGTFPFDPTIEPSTGGNRNLVRLFACWGASFRDVHVANLTYPLLVTLGTRNTEVNGIWANNCRHMVAPSDWPKGTTVRNFHASDCYQALDGHPCFDLAYEDGTIERDSSLSNMRCVRGALRRVRMHTLADNTQAEVYYHNLTPGADTSSYLYADADFHIEDVEVKSPNRTLPCISVDRGRNVFVDGLVADAFGCSLTVLNQVGQLIWGPNNRIGDKSGPPRRIAVGGTAVANGIRCPIRVMQPPRLDAYLDTGVYHIDPRLSMVDQNGKRLVCHGKVAAMLAGTPQTLAVRVHTNAFGPVDNLNWAQGRIRITVKARHSSAAYFASLTKEYNFIHKAVATSLMVMPTTPVFTSSPSGQSNESNLTLAISSPTQAGGTELGASGDFYIAFNIDVAMGVVTSPIFDVDYELELEAQE